ncbi:MAG: type II secretion system GspH family protein, partial [Chloroflexi bacterium]|nr:type II secretion system GspH family protein [Chloroflexota bacterium]
MSQGGHKKSIQTGGFTLIELLVVIAILATLSVSVILVLNPAELLKEGRDSTRLSDLASLNTALGVFLADTWGSQPLGTSGITYLSLVDPTATTTSGTDCTGLGFPSGSFHCSASSTVSRVDGTGWIPINLSLISSGAPLSKLPTDPLNASSSGYYYAFSTNGSSYKVTALPESSKYALQAGATPTLFQTGSNLNLGGGPDWVLVPGNSAFGTQNFYVMKYDAGCSDGNGTPVNTPLAGQGYNWGTSCLGKVASLPNAAPIVDISHTQALSACASIGAHLLTNDEYMTIVTNAANQGVNWSGGVMPRGNSD